MLKNESQNIEYKETWRDEYLKWICGFANAQGGVLAMMKRFSIEEIIAQRDGVVTEENDADVGNLSGVCREFVGS